jgi:tetratricopeptide (TPR) repeat protein
MDYTVPLLFAMIVSMVQHYLYTVLHEFGHAIPLALFTRQKVTLFLGTYGRKEISKSFTIGLFEIWYRIDKHWDGGIVLLTGKPLTRFQYIFLIINGSLFPVVVYTLLFLILFSADAWAGFTLSAFFGLISGLYHLVINLYPVNKPIKIDNNSPVYNDGYRIKHALGIKPKYWEQYRDATTSYERGDYEQAGQLYEGLMQHFKTRTDYARGAITSYLNARNPVAALRVHDILLQQVAPVADDYYNAGLAKMFLGLYKEAVEDFEAVIKINGDYFYAHVYISYIYISNSQVTEALNSLKYCLTRAPKDLHTLSLWLNAYLSIRRNDLALLYLNKLIELHHDNPFTYLCRGWYHFNMKEYQQALQFYTKAKAMDRSLAGIDDSISETEEELKKNPPTPNG